MQPVHYFATLQLEETNAMTRTPWAHKKKIPEENETAMFDMKGMLQSLEKTQPRKIMVEEDVKIEEELVGSYARTAERIGDKTASYEVAWREWEKRQRHPNDVKLGAYQPSAIPIDDEVTVKKRHRVGKWLRASFHWCAETLSFCCLRPSTHTAYLEQHGVHQRSFGQVPTQGSVFEPIDDDTSVEVTHRSTAVHGDNGDIRAKTTSESLDPHSFEPNSEADLEYRLQSPLDWTTTESEHRQEEMERRLVQLLSSTTSSREELPTHQGRLSSRYSKHINGLNLAGLQLERVEPNDLAAPEPTVLPVATPVPDVKTKSGPWSSDEHERYCAGLEMYRYGSWKLVADYVGTRTERQVMSHAQSIRAKRKRAENRDTLSTKLRITEDATNDARAKMSRTEDTTSATMTMNRKLAPEELLLSSLVMPIQTSSNSHETPKIPFSHSTDASIGMMAPIPLLTAEDCECGLKTSELPAHNATEQEKSHDREEDFLLRLSDECLLLASLEDVEATLCSPPPDLLRRSVLSDEDLRELLDFTSKVSALV